jgi:hypothetical protein
VDREALKRQIIAAFADVEYPGDWCLRGSDEGDEPYRLEKEFQGKNDWSALAPEFIDNAPGGLASALSFFSDEAFRFYLPAYVIADIDQKLSRADPLFHLTHGLDDESKGERINPRRFGDRTWFEYQRFKFSIFSVPQVRALIGYLEYKRGLEDLPEFQRAQIEQALRNYWNGRAA